MITVHLSSPICSECNMMCWVEWKLGKLVATHPTHSATCKYAGKAFEVPVLECKELPDEYRTEVNI